MRLGGIYPSWIAFGWFIGAACTGLALLGLFGLGIAEADPAAGDPWVAASIAVGFLLGGIVVGLRVGETPILHGVGIGIFSLLVWFGVNLFLGEPTDQTAWSAVDAGRTRWG